MTDLMTVAELMLLLETMFASMLEGDELASLEFRIERLADAAAGSPLDPDASLAPDDTWVRWRVLGEDGSSGGLRFDGGPEVLVRHVQSDLQDFIAESRFGWGQLRGPRDLP